MLIEILKFILLSILIVLISKYVLVKVLRKLAESLNLSSKIVGNIAGVATSVPEFLTVVLSTLAGLGITSMYNILSSNVINLVQYILAIFINKNQKEFKNMAIKIQLVMVLITIIIPIFLLVSKIEFVINFVPIFILLFILFYYINSNIHKLYLIKTDERIYSQIEKEKKWVKGKMILVSKYSTYLVFVSVTLYLIGNQLSIVLDRLANIFYIPEFIIGITLGFITSIPELMTFFESQKHYKKTEKTDSQEGVIEATNNLLASNTLNLFIIQTIGIIIIHFI